MFTSDELTRSIDLLRHGGQEGVDLFMRIAKTLLLSAGETALESWVSIAAPALPEEERNLVFTALLTSTLSAQSACDLERPPAATLH